MAGHRRAPASRPARRRFGRGRLSRPLRRGPPAGLAPAVLRVRTSDGTVRRSGVQGRDVVDEEPEERSNSCARRSSGRNGILPIATHSTVRWSRSRLSAISAPELLAPTTSTGRPQLARVRYSLEWSCGSPDRARGEVRDSRPVVGAGRDDDLGGLVAPGRGDAVPWPSSRAEPVTRTPVRTGRSHARRRTLEVVGHLVLGRETVRVGAGTASRAGCRRPGVNRRSDSQRAPRVADPLAVEDHESGRASASWWPTARPACPPPMITVRTARQASVVRSRCSWGGRRSAR